ncbi:hypothetical protein BSY17_4192 (plasmid) [Sphingobium sp. RAC03]|nr:hypothetical protein BSY17_4192 [Sphingobium sp. RAC03]
MILTNCVEPADAGQRKMSGGGRPQPRIDQARCDGRVGTGKWAHTAGTGHRRQLIGCGKVQRRPMACAVVVRNGLIRIALRLIGIAFAMHGAAALDRDSARSLLRVHGSRHHQG